MSLKNTFFLDIWNSLIKINENNIFIIFDIDGNIWFGLKDLIKALGYKSIQNIYRMNIPKNFINIINKIKVPPSMGIPYNFQPDTILINEEGLDYILIKSNKNIAKDFIKKYVSDIIRYVIKKSKDFFIIISIDKLN